jgi:peptide/nickel transport system permease protein
VTAAVTTASGGLTAPSRWNPVKRFARQYVRMPTGVAGLVVLVGFLVLALTAPLYIGANNLDVTKVNGPLLAPPSSAYWLGTDLPGRSVLLLTIWGSRASLSIGIIATVLTMILGTSIGLIAGHFQGAVSRVLMTITDWFITLPSLPLAISLAAIIGQGATSITVAIAVTSWPATARLVRAQTLAVEARPFIERARALGAGNTQIMSRQVLPNVMPLVLVSSTLTIAGAILSETTLSFLGLGDPSTVSWGNMINQAFTTGAITRGAWWYLLPPGIAIVLVVLGFTMTGRAVENILNPRMVGARS